MATNEQCKRDFEWPKSLPIHLDGEADAYTDETSANAYKRLFYVGCQCGFMVNREASVHGAAVVVYGQCRTFRLRFSPDDDKLLAITWRREADRKGEWNRGWHR